ncbi:MAG: hypothetical protein JWO63_2211 [Frankiales bacterium]|nr:hypothetical protein [Frankiales bacterium]
MDRTAMDRTAMDPTAVKAAATSSGESSAVADAASLLGAIATEFSSLARAMMEGEEDSLVIAKVVRFAAHAVPGSRHAGLTVVRGVARPHTLVATDDIAPRLDALQFELAQGPALQALVQSDVAHAADLSADGEWPVFGPRAYAETGIRSMLCLRLFLTGEHRASLNFYSPEPAAFDEASLATAAMFAAYASLVQLNTVHKDANMNLQRALESNREIGVAMGILMARNLFTSDQAFEHLRVASQHTHRRLREIAADVVTTGEIPYYPED